MADENVINHFKQDNIISDFLKSYDIKSMDRTSVFIQQRKNLIAEQVKVNFDTARILEVGCGIGDVSIDLAKNGYDCTAIDTSDEAIKTAKQQTPESLKGSVKFSVQDLNDLPHDNAYDVVIANGVIPYFKDKNNFLRLIAGQLKKNGMSFITHKNALFNLFALNEGTLDFMQDHFSVFNKNLKSELEQSVAGLSEKKNQFTNSHLYRSEEIPFEMSELYNDMGLNVTGIKYCCIHTQPPRIDNSPAEDFIRAHDMFQSDWKGMFLGSQFLVVAKKQ